MMRLHRSQSRERNFDRHAVRGRPQQSAGFSPRLSQCRARYPDDVDPEPSSASSGNPLARSGRRRTRRGGSRQVFAITYELGIREMHCSTAATRHTGVTCSESAHRLCETEHVRAPHAWHWRSSLLEHNSSPSSDRLQSVSVERDRENAACGSNRVVARSCRSREMIGDGCERVPCQRSFGKPRRLANPQKIRPA